MKILWSLVELGRKAPWRGTETGPGNIFLQQREQQDPRHGGKCDPDLKPVLFNSHKRALPIAERQRYSVRSSGRCREKWQNLYSRRFRQVRSVGQHSDAPQGTKAGSCIMVQKKKPQPLQQKIWLKGRRF